MNSNLFQKIQSAVQGKKHIIWDWNGTLLDDVGHAVSVVNTLLEEHNLSKIDVHQYRKLFEFPVLKYYQRLGFDFEKETFEELCHKFVERFMAGVKDLPLIPEMKTVLLENHHLGLTQSVLSATDQHNLNSMITHYNLKDIFQFVYGIDNKLAASKVKRGHELIGISNISKHETVIIGDTLHDLEVAHSLGIDAILISHGHQCPTRLKPHHDLVIEV